MSNNIVECFIEISKHSNIKYELTENKLKLDRVLFGSLVYPHNYGFIVNTLSEDNDPLDVLLISNFSLTPGTYAEGRVLGALEMVDAGEEDLKIIAVMDKDPRLAHINSLSELPNFWFEELKNFFEEYKKLEKKEVKIGNLVPLSEALEFINKARDKYNSKL
ncbi:inorganic pyrophosphatase [Mycoplasma wenyonii str. Massachusetts]|uniref:inorganic diphosphatase n=1 Tax=Mycoplasma wenyonii (strain Massachusetts) TaxID=1197325 RepID=I6Z614_MYCWM|nr:inorganic diphosphatase [Mycoplasma wenyonii]AFN65013.1 inorganic pyrophosphatase [Mycoplasma wenyonii str. Massachusetts]